MLDYGCKKRIAAKHYHGYWSGYRRYQIVLLTKELCRLRVVDGNVANYVEAKSEPAVFPQLVKTNDKKPREKAAKMSG